MQFALLVTVRVYVQPARPRQDFLGQSMIPVSPNLHIYGGLLKTDFYQLQSMVSHLVSHLTPAFFFQGVFHIFQQHIIVSLKSRVVTKLRITQSLLGIGRYGWLGVILPRKKILSGDLSRTLLAALLHLLPPPAASNHVR